MAIALASDATSIGAIAKDIWNDVEGSAINEEVAILKNFDVHEEAFEGNKFIYVDVTQHNQSTTEIPEAGSLPTAGREVRVRREITTQEVVQVGGLSWKAYNIARKKGRGAITSAVKSEMQGSMKEFKRHMARRCVTGGSICGVTNEKKVTEASGAAAGTVAGARVAFQFSGDYAYFDNVVFANTATWVRVNLIDCSRAVAGGYAALPPAGGGAGAVLALFVVGTNKVNGTIDLAVVSDVVGAGALATTAGVASGFCAALELSDTQYQIAGVDFGTIAKTSGGLAINGNTPEGILSNLCAPTQYTLSRATGAAGEKFQAHIMCQDTGALPQARQAITNQRLEACLAAVNDASGEDPDLLFVNRLSLHTYMAATINNLRYNVQDVGKKVDIGTKYSNMMVLGLPAQTSQWVPRGMMLFLKKSSWHRLETQSPTMIDGDVGTPHQKLFFTNNTAAYQFVVYSDWNLFCRESHENLIYTGFLW